MFNRWRQPDEVLKHVRTGGRNPRRLRHAGPEHATVTEIVPFELASPEVSLSDIRQRVAAGETIDDLVPPAVARVIEELGLYR